MKNVIFAAGLLTSLLVSITASAAKTNYKTDLDPGQENVAPNIAGHDPTGSAKFTFDDTTDFLCGEISFDDTTSAVTGVHIHYVAPPTDPTADSTVKLLIAPTASPVKFKLKLPADFKAGLIAQPTRLYANVHTTNNAGGELRSFTPWLTEGATEVTCPATETNPDGGTVPPTTTPDAGPLPPPGPTTPPTSTTKPPPATTSDPGANPGGGDAPLASATPPVEDTKKGCSAAGSPAGAVSFALLAGLGMLVVRGRRRNRK